MTEPSTMKTMTISWHENAVKRAVENARAMLDHGIDDTPIVRSTPGVPLTWQDVAVLVDIARQFQEERVEAAANAATLNGVEASLTILLENYEQVPENLADCLDRVRLLTDTLAWLHAEAAHQRDEARAEVQEVRLRAENQWENEHAGYIRHRDALITALGEHADLSATTIMQIINRDVTALREAYETVEAELIEWRTGQRAVEASSAQWVQIQTTLDETLAAVRQMAGQLGQDAQREQLRGELPTGGEPCPVAVGADADENIDFCHEPAAPSLEVCERHADGPVVETAAEPARFTHDNEE